jgi:hypothetical protein
MDSLSWTAGPWTVGRPPLARGVAAETSSILLAGEAACGRKPDAAGLPDLDALSRQSARTGGATLAGRPPPPSGKPAGLARARPAGPLDEPPEWQWNSTLERRTAARAVGPVTGTGLMTRWKGAFAFHE